MPDISVQVPVRDGGDRFKRFLGCLAGQDYSREWELVIVDDGSRMPVQTRFISELSLLPDNCTVKVIRLDPGGNRPAARNAALQASSSPVGLLMDADLEFSGDLLSGHLDVMERTGADVVMGKRVNAWSPQASPWQRWMDSRAMGDSPAGPFPWRYFITGNLSVKCSLLRDAGGFDPAIDHYGGEDTEMGFRLSEAGASFHWEPALAVDHMDEVTVREHSRKMLEYGATGLRYTLDKHPRIQCLLGSRWVEPLLQPPLYLLPVKLAVRPALFPWVYRHVLSYAENHGGPPFLFTWLSVGGCLMGLTGRDPEL